MKTILNKPEKIESIRKRFHKQWLLIAVETVDDSKTSPLTGRLLAHDPDPMKIHRTASKSRFRRLMTVYSDEWPQDLAAAFLHHV